MVVKPEREQTFFARLLMSISNWPGCVNPRPETHGACFHETLDEEPLNTWILDLDLDLYLM